METPASDPASDAEKTFYGASWATILGVTLLVAFALITAARRLGNPAAADEKIIQIPVVAAAPTPLPPPEILAPDPGDTP